MSLVEKNSMLHEAGSPAAQKTAPNGGHDDRLSEAGASEYITLLKPRVMSLVVFTGFVGLIVAPGSMNPVLAAIAILCIAVGGGASGALNMWYDADIDIIMKRTRNRPIPAGLVRGETVLAYGIVLSVFSVLTLGLMVNWLSGALLAFTIFFYAVVYTMWLKRSTPQNIVIGGASGAFPPMIGWAAATGTISMESVVLFLIIFLWTPPHFWALSLFTSTDYEAAKVPMMPNVRGEKYTRLQILLYSLIVAPVGVLPYFLGFGGVVYGVVSALLGAMFVWRAAQLWQAPEHEQQMRAARALFKFSLIYLFALFSVLLVEALVAKAVIMLGV